METLTNAETALLALLSEKPMHPYLIEQEVQYRDMRFWTDLSMSSIYKLLKKMEKQGLIERENVISPENRLQKVYSMSEQGKTALAEKLETLLREPEHMRWQVDIGIYNSDLLTAKKVRAALKKYRAELEKKVTDYGRLLDFLVQSECPRHRHEVAKRPVFLLQAEIEWVDSYLSSLTN